MHPNSTTCESVPWLSFFSKVVTSKTFFSCCFKIIACVFNFSFHGFICWLSFGQRFSFYRNIVSSSIFFPFLSFKICFCGVPMRMSERCLPLARFFSPVGRTNWATAPLVTVSEYVSGLCSTSLEHEGWQDCVPNPAIRAVTMKIILALFLENAGSITDQGWVMAVIWPPITATHNLYRKPYG